MTLASLQQIWNYGRSDVPESGQNPWKRQSHTPESQQGKVDLQRDESAHRPNVGAISTTLETSLEANGGSTLRQALLILLWNSVDRVFHPRQLPRRFVGPTIVVIAARL